MRFLTEIAVYLGNGTI